MNNIPTFRRPAQAALTLVEVVIALSVLVGALLLSVGQFANISSMQRQNNMNSVVDRIVQSLVDRINSVTWSHLATGRAPWTIARYEPQADGTYPQIGVAPGPDRGRGPMTFRNIDDFLNPIADIDSLVGLGLNQSVEGTEDLRVYLEYYRAVGFVDATGTNQAGLLEDCTDAIGSQGFRAIAYNNAGTPQLGVKSAYLLSGWDPDVADNDTSTGNSPGLQSAIIDPTHPLLIRIIAVWDDADPDPTVFRPRQRREIFTARSP